MLVLSDLSDSMRLLYLECFQRLLHPPSYQATICFPRLHKKSESCIYTNKSLKEYDTIKSSSDEHKSDEDE